MRRRPWASTTSSARERSPDRERPWAVWLSSHWGLSWVAIKYSLQDIPPFLGVALRGALAALTLGLFARFRKKRLLITPQDLRLLALTGIVIYSGNYGLIHWSEQHLTAGVTAVLFSTNPIFVALQNDLLKLNPRQEH